MHHARVDERVHEAPLQRGPGEGLDAPVHRLHLAALVRAQQLKHVAASNHQLLLLGR